MEPLSTARSVPISIVTIYFEAPGRQEENPAHLAFAHSVPSAY